jgi:hypothetical protein
VDALQALGYEGFREGNFLSLIDTLNRAVDRHFTTFAGEPNPNILVTQIEPDQLKAELCDVLRRAADKHNASPLWFDKTGNPEMIEAVPTLRVMWPRSRFIFAKRRAIENISSRLKKFPQHTFEYHCTDWARNMSAWRKIRDTLPRDTFVEIDQQDLLTNPEECAEKIISLTAHRFVPKDTVAAVFRESRAQETRDGSAKATYALEDMEWTEAQITSFNKHCLSEMEHFGYSTGISYWI